MDRSRTSGCVLLIIKFLESASIRRRICSKIDVAVERFLCYSLTGDVFIDDKTDQIIEKIQDVSKIPLVVFLDSVAFLLTTLESTGITIISLMGVGA